MPKCTATTAKATPCRAWAVRGSQPPRCSAHGGGRGPEGAPNGNENAVSRGGCLAADADRGQLERRSAAAHDEATGDLNAVISDLHRRLDELSGYIDTNRDDLTTAEYLAAVRLQGMLSNRIGRLHRDRAELHRDADDLDRAIDAALDVVGGLLGVDL